MAVINGHMEIVRFLCAKGAKIGHADSRGCTVLHHAAKLGNKELMMLLLEKGGLANIDDRNQDGQTAVHVSVRYGHAEVVTLLLESGEIFWIKYKRQVFFTLLKTF